MDARSQYGNRARQICLARLGLGLLPGQWTQRGDLGVFEVKCLYIERFSVLLVYVVFKLPAIALF